MLELVTWAAPVTDGVLWWFAESTVVAGLLAMTALLASGVRRPRLGPATRHVLWLMVLVKLAAPPLVHWPWSIRSPAVPSAQTSSRTEIPSIQPLLRPSTVESAWKSGTVPETARGPDETRATSAPSRVDRVRGGASERASNAAWPSLVRGLGAAIVLAWLVGSIVLALRQIGRVVRFRRALVGALPAPGWLFEEAAEVGRTLAVRVPEIRVVPGLETPLLWCLGRPVLLVPVPLLKTLESDRWRAILAHELAHLRRRDHWVRRLELLAGLAWWWNPLYWLTLRRLDHEAELACDAWVLWASPNDRIRYAESLIRICSALTTTDIAAPSLGIAGTGPSFERRLTMILNERVDRRVSLASVPTALLLAALSLPTWTVAEEAKSQPEPTALPALLAVVAPISDPSIVLFSDAIIESVDDDDEPSPKEDDARKDAERSIRKKKEALDRDLKEKLGPDSEFVEKMEAVGKDLEKKLGPGSDFARKMEALGQEMAGKFGPNSDFVREIRLNFGPDSDFAKELVKALGPDSDFAKQMKQLGIDIKVTARTDAKGIGDEARKLKMDAEQKARDEARKGEVIARRAKLMAEDQARKAEAQARKIQQAARAREKIEAAREVAKPGLDARKQAGRIEALQARIEEMQRDLDKLKAETKDEDQKR